MRSGIPRWRSRARLLLTMLSAGCLEASEAYPGRVVHGDHAIEWPSYGADPGGSRHSAASRITPENVHRLRVAWVYRTGDYRIGERGARFQATPLMREGTVYVSTPFGRVVALDALTGEERWNHDPGVRLDGGYGDWANRGVAIWRGPGREQAASCGQRVFVAPIDARLIALDAVTGRPCGDFGRGGQVDLNEGLREPPDHAGEYQVTSPPAIAGDLVIVGSAIADNRRVRAPSGVVRAFDVRSGAERWAWDPIWSGAKHVPGAWQDAVPRSGAANAWAPIAVDTASGLVFVPVGAPSPDYYGVQRPGRNDYANSIVALDAVSGEVAWHFQVVHHDLWDYDVPAQPVLASVRGSGGDVPVVIQTTKVGHVFVLDRRSGRPVFGVDSRTVSTAGIEGEHPWPVQPFPKLPEPLVPQRLTAEMGWGINAEDREHCRARIRALRGQGIFTPPTREWTLVYPGNLGGSNWSGLTMDPVRRLVIVPTNNLAAAVRLVPRSELEAAVRAHPSAEAAPQRGTPFGMQREFLTTPGGIPCNPPPWGALTAIDLDSGARLWQVPLGAMPSLAGVDGVEQWGSPNLGGAMSTASGLTFVSGGLDERLHAFESVSGRRLWSAPLPAGGNASPMTYVLGGRQFILIAAGGHDRLGTTPGDYLVAFALPEDAPAHRATPPAAGDYHAVLLVGNGRYQWNMRLAQADEARTVAGSAMGELRGALRGTEGRDSVTIEFPFVLPSESCAAEMRGTLARANGGSLLVGTVQLLGGCTDGVVEEGVLVMRRTSFRARDALAP